MLITRETDYALRILRALAKSRQLTAGALSRNEQIPEQFAYKILKKLERARMVEIIRGKDGGCRLAANLDTVSLYDLLLAMGAESRINMCLLPDYECAWCETHEEACAVHERLVEIQAVLDNELRSHSLHRILYGKMD